MEVEPHFYQVLLSVQRAQRLLVSVKAQPINHELCSITLGLSKGEETPTTHDLQWFMGKAVLLDWPFSVGSMDEVLLALWRLAEKHSAKNRWHPAVIKEEFDPLLLLLVIQDDNGRQAPLAQCAGEKVGFNVLPGTVGSKDWLVISPRRSSWVWALLKTKAGQRRKRLDKYDLCLFLLTCRCGLSDVNTIKLK